MVNIMNRIIKKMFEDMVAVMGLFAAWIKSANISKKQQDTSLIFIELPPQLALTSG